jgi:Bacterial Ig-like domain (group 1)
MEWRPAHNRSRSVAGRNAQEPQGGGVWPLEVKMGAYKWISVAGVLALAAACGDDSRVGPTPLMRTPSPPAAVPAATSLVSGNDQLGKAGEQLAEPFIVRVTDANDNPATDALVSFQIRSGAGALGGRCDVNAPAVIRSSPTSSDGLATMAFMPTVLGRSTVTATINGRDGSSVTFSSEATSLVVEFWFGFWNVGFIGPCTLSSVVIAPVGTTVEWKIPAQDDRYPITYTVTSTSAPPGAKGFDSGVMTAYERFRFVPPVAGTWEYRDQVTGLTGTLTAR